MTIRPEIHEKIDTNCAIPGAPDSAGRMAVVCETLLLQWGYSSRVQWRASQRCQSQRCAHPLFQVSTSNPISIMSRKTFCFYILLACAVQCLVLWPSTACGQQQPGVGVETQPLADFQLKDTEGRSWSLNGLADKKLLVVAFVGCECPLARLYTGRLGELRLELSDQSVGWLLVNSNQQDSLKEMQYFAQSNNLEIPLLKDPGNRIADLFGAGRTPEVFVLDQQRRIRYRGRVDDQYTYGRQRPAATSEELKTALAELLQDQPVTTPVTTVSGCIIGREFSTDTATADMSVTWCNQISRIMQQRCQSCHRAGEIGPFELGTYEEAVGWAGMINEVVTQRRMPPWSANPEFGQFKNDCRLSDDEIAMINTWVKNGAPQGDPAESPPPAEFFTGWQMGEPDLVIPMAKKPFHVPATGTVEYQYFRVPTGFTEDKWVSAAECRADQRGVIHHIIVGIRGQGDFGRGVHDQIQSDWIAASAPGSPPMVLPEGYAKLVPAGSELIFQVHYTPNGTAADDLSSIGLKFIPAELVTHRVYTLKAHNERFRIPPGADNHPVQARQTLENTAELISLFPHMHLRGKSFRYTAVFPDGQKEILLDVPGYDFNWQNGYELAERRIIPSGTEIQCLAHFDNSEKNLANPDPAETVRWGDQTWEEMMIGYFNVALPVENQPIPDK